MTSRIVGEFVNNITKRSMPIPIPPVGGMPVSSAAMKSSSTSSQVDMSGVVVLVVTSVDC